MVTITKDECAKMCDEMGCSEEEKAMCMLRILTPTENSSKKADCKMACCATDGVMRKRSFETNFHPKKKR